MKRSCLVLALIALTGACNKNSTSTSTPTTPTTTPSVTSVTVTVKAPAVGRTAQATATATLSDGGSAAVTSGFNGDALSVASVSPTGAITGLQTGAITVWADYQGVRGTTRLQILPDYSGTYSGNYSLNSCQSTGDFATAGFCASFFQGQVLAIGLNSAQSSDLRTITGTFALGGNNGTGTGSVSLDGTLVYSGSVLGAARIDLQNWVSTSPSFGRITGSFEQQWSSTTLAGTARLFCNNLNLTRTSASTAPAHVLGGHATLEQMLSLVKQQ